MEKTRHAEQSEDVFSLQDPIKSEHDSSQMLHCPHIAHTLLLSVLKWQHVAILVR